MQIKIIPKGNPSLGALFERFNEAADSRGIDRERALIEALRAWLNKAGEENEGEEIIEATEREFRAITATLAAIREARV